MGADGIVIRRAADGDAARMAEVWLRSFDAALPTVRRAHSDDEVRDWFAGTVVPLREAWVVVTGDDVTGLLVLGEDDELEQLYIEPVWRGRGLGDLLIGLAKERRPAGLGLWTFQVNESARRFYERHGFTEAERTDGAGNEEREPDVRYTWTGSTTGAAPRSASGSAAPAAVRAASVPSTSC